MKFRVAQLTILVFALLSPPLRAFDGTPIESMEVVTVTPSNVIEHEVELKGKFDDEKTEIFLEGPQMFSQAVGLPDKSVQNENIFFNWYKISRPAQKLNQIVSVTDPFREKNKIQLDIQDSAFLLSPSQKVSSGSPGEVPEGMGCFQAFEIRNGTGTRMSISLSHAVGPQRRIMIKLAYICFPAEQWHHHEHFPVKNWEECLLVYQLEPLEIDRTITTIDQFGLNKLSVKSTNLLCVPAKLIDISEHEK